MGAQWKREKVQDHKFDFINVEDFVDKSCWRQFRYSLVFAAVIRGILIYCADIFTAVNLWTGHGSVLLGNKDNIAIGDVFGLKELPMTIYKYIFTACIGLSFLLLAWDIRRAKGIIASKDISYAFTSLIASRYYTVRSYAHYCLFSKINNSKKRVDDIAFFCFFKFRGWKRLILADAPRQCINASILYMTFFGPGVTAKPWDWDGLFGNNTVQNALLRKLVVSSMLFTVAMFAFSLVSLIAAVVMYLPLLSHIQGNLKEFCCHKIDKRIDELIKKNTKARAMAAHSGKKGGKDAMAMAPMKQPTLPQLDLLEKPKPTPALKSAMATPYYGNNNLNNRNQGYDNYGNQHTGYEQDYGNQYGMQQQQQQQQGGYYNSSQQDYYGQTNSPSSGTQYGGNSSKGTTVVDPYAESAYATDDIYAAYGGTTDQTYLQQGAGGGGAGGGGVGGGSDDVYSYNNTGYQQQSSQQTPRTRQYDNYGHQQQRPTSPLGSSQHGSDMDNYNNMYGQSQGQQQGGYNDYDYGASPAGVVSPQTSPRNAPARGRRQANQMMGGQQQQQQYQQGGDRYRNNNGY